MPTNELVTAGKNPLLSLDYVRVTQFGESGELAHWHDSLEIVVADQGSLRCQTDQHAFDLDKGDVCFINHQHLHRLVGPGGTDDGTGWILLLNPDMFINDRLFSEEYVRAILNDENFGHFRVPGNFGEAEVVREEVGQINSLLTTRPFAYEIEVLASCLKIARQLVIAVHERTDSPDPVDNDMKLLKKMIAYIHDHFFEETQLESIANAANVSKSTCTRLFKRFTGRTPIGFLTDYRLEHAATLLRTTRDSISSISQACGFTQQSYFGKRFLRAYGMTPSAWREKEQPATLTA